MMRQPIFFQRILAAICRTLGFAILGLLSCQAMAQRVAITFDDGLDPRIEPRAAQWNAYLLETLAKHRVRAMIFPAGIFVDSPEGLALVRAWGAAGHGIGDHTYTHRGFLDDTTPEAFMQDVLRDQALVNTMPGWCPRLRLPYLNEGSTPERRNRLYNLLAQHGYGVAPVTITIDDWNYSERFIAAANKNPKLDVDQYRKPYLDRLWQEVRKQQAQWQQRLGRSPVQVLLLHTNGLNTIVLPDILAMFERNGWTFADPAEAFTDPIYQRPYTIADGTQHALPIPACR
ncbi:polysaccharide deacetylase family protein [Achromobacter aloeverae]|uniref:Polysaccharide deacetylase n=1 Tax=Achromobacter aloeverae TaxID=1750518 RepID=A0A4Q1HIE5_9BURK|nr:polysaccharide deacetylase family protein [Achromobacter aloeverae]RXN86644.1 polysaccharide deacetylase [Achromobacter aloeverae]